MTKALAPRSRTQINEGFFWEQDCPPEWRARLAQVSPQNDQVEWLWLDWFAGEPYQPVQRWALYSIKPRELVFHLVEQEIRSAGILNAATIAADYHRARHLSFTAHLWAELQGPNPRTLGRWAERVSWASGEPVRERFWDTDCLITRDQWEIMRKTGGLPQLYWVIQGERGGHKLMLSAEEANLLRLAGMERAELPEPGALPYAPFDERVVEQVVRRDRLRRWGEKYGKGFAARYRNQRAAGHLVAEERRGARIEARLELQKWLKEQVEYAAAELARHVSMADLPRGNGHYDRDIDEVERSFVEDI